DLHIHSCLSPCGDDEMTVNNIVNMSIINNLDIIALTDHNSCKNCPAILKIAKEAGKLVIPGMELCTSEEIHVICLFPELEQAMAFDKYVYQNMPHIPNRKDIFGEQWILNEEDKIIDTEPFLLVTASDISLEKLPNLMKEYGGLAIPAHIDKDSYSILAVYGFIPPELGFTAVEIAKPQPFLEKPFNQKQIQGKRLISNSDAHYLWSIKEFSPDDQEEKQIKDTMPLHALSYNSLYNYLLGE
ncbi:MAG: PHP domain-containing protein, partial [Clostridiales bacterium]